MRFSIRDLLWLTVVVALGVGWWGDHRRQAREIEELKEQQEQQLKKVMERARSRSYWVLPTSQSPAPIPPKK